MTFTFEWECRELVSTLHVYRALTEGYISKSFKISKAAKALWTRGAFGSKLFENSFSRW